MNYKITVFSRFGKFGEFSAKFSKYKMPKTQKMLGLARVADIHQAVWQVLAKIRHRPFLRKM